jgi:Cellulose biosynthesis protein BcsS
MRPCSSRSVLSVALVLAAIGGSPAWSADMPMPEPPERLEHLFLFGGTDYNSFNSYFAWGGATWAPWGLDKSGPRFTGFGGYGTYTYNTSVNSRNHGRFGTTDGLIGWAIATEKTNTKFMVGINAQDQILTAPDPTNPVQGSKIGVKGQIDTWITPTDSTMIFALGSYSTAFRTWYTELKLGVALLHDTEVYIGPQVIGLGNERFQQWRVGAHITGMHLGIVNVTIAGGYMNESDLGGGAYAMITGDMRF